ncbi:MAG: hypothetical protein Q6353_021180, partial [Candidatus Sigynarchaeum springense]
READPDITDRELEAKFLVSSRIVADALKMGRETWEAMLAPASRPAGFTTQGANGAGRVDQPAIHRPGAPRAASPSPSPSPSPTRYLAVTIEPVAGRGDPPPFRYKAAQADAEWHQADTPGIEGILGDLAKQGWELVYMGRIGLGHAAASAFGGSYECIFVQR